ncbi:MAG: hypothetical protein EPN85_13610 [Bacteroidetes bacterium]|nr:MAG: hypothetical protein EPN85_13610 [Bacteroidota bacterium]
MKNKISNHDVSQNGGNLLLTTSAPIMLLICLSAELSAEKNVNGQDGFKFTEPKSCPVTEKHSKGKLFTQTIT